MIELPDLAVGGLAAGTLSALVLGGGLLRARRGQARQRAEIAALRTQLDGSVRAFTAEVEHLAGSRLPAAARRVSHPHLEIPGPLQPLTAGTPLGVALEKVLEALRVEVTAQRGRVDAAAQAGMRGATREIQAALYRLQDALRGLQQQYDEPELAQTLFRLDHENEQSLRRAQVTAVVCGAWVGLAREESHLVDAVTGGQARLAGYHRVTVHNHLEPGTALVSHAVEPVAIIVAELLDNALRHSAPDTDVVVGLEHVHHGVCVTIDDAGVGMTQDERERAQRLVAGDTPIHLTELGDPPRMGLAAIGRLTRQFELAVDLTSASPYGGVRAVLRIGTHLLTRLDPTRRPPSVSAPRTTRKHPEPRKAPGTAPASASAAPHPTASAPHAAHPAASVPPAPHLTASAPHATHPGASAPHAAHPASSTPHAAPHQAPPAPAPSATPPSAARPTPPPAPPAPPAPTPPPPPPPPVPAPPAPPQPTPASASAYITAPTNPDTPDDDFDFGDLPQRRRRNRSARPAPSGSTPQGPVGGQEWSSPRRPARTPEESAAALGALQSGTAAARSGRDGTAAAPQEHWTATAPPRDGSSTETLRLTPTPDWDHTPAQPIPRPPVTPDPADDWSNDDTPPPPPPVWASPDLDTPDDPAMDETHEWPHVPVPAPAEDDTHDRPVTEGTSYDWSRVTAPLADPLQEPDTVPHTGTETRPEPEPGLGLDPGPDFAPEATPAPEPRFEYVAFSLSEPTPDPRPAPTTAPAPEREREREPHHPDPHPDFERTERQGDPTR
ncbi:protein kinase [Streptomyces niveiscabiei]|uniref:ATP-binding protein n=1 Tax=Streptomyces niveiscabiei TaxID=164115 RepID=UPI0029A26258|nr:ATP-binding protein [Streptomyces niveiscabiei]MDX3381916.1 protein kinase [Streptomyces niveiscabiei]